MADQDQATDSVTEETSIGWGQRITQSFGGVIVGLVLILVSIGALWWNEGRAVQAATGLTQADRSVVEAKPDQVDSGLDGKLVHVVGAMTTTSPARDEAFGVGGKDLVRLHRTVEMLQWKEEERTQTRNQTGGGQVQEKTYTYVKTWSDRPIDSARFHVPDGHRNSPMALTSADFESSEAKLGAYRLDPMVLAAMSNFAPFMPSGAAPPSDYHAEGDGFYRGQNSADPGVGDLRVTFTAVAAQTMSIVAGQAGERLAPFRVANGYPITLAEPGVASAEQMIKEKAAAEHTVTWIVRGGGFVAMLIGFLLFTRPLSIVASVVPFLGGLVEAGAFILALTIAAPLTLVIIALAWLGHRPLIGGGLIALAAILWAASIHFHRRRPSAKAAG